MQVMKAQNLQLSALPPLGPGGWIQKMVMMTIMMVKRQPLHFKLSKRQ